ncbi:hypothetical protein IC614_06250 [Allosphingosinicella flava]|uniref:Esterase n=1 Tax=Allosphingosinicella flava TaxID=2771430 RepID=A0A7T2GLS0_9SPHN|nr:alpha/beta hydrolase [Sphingosinicella flava]QPQ56157.1 hypothetical protein IC614_06250 [Sphingosinicella flava]
MLRGLLLCALLFAGAAAPAKEPGRLIRYDNVQSANLLPRSLTIWLPPGYDGSDERYPVLYMHDGHNLFDAATSNFNKEWGVDEAMERLVLEGTVRPAIVVGVWATEQRLRDYMPAKVAAALPEPYRAQLRELHKGLPLSDDYLRFLVKELKPWVDRSFRTLPGKDNTFISGSSMGGLISLYAMAEYPEVFGKGAAISTHWPLFLSWPVEPRPDAEKAAVTAAFETWLETALPSPTTHALYFDHGTETIDVLYAPYQERVDRVVQKRGYRRGENWLTCPFPGAAHEENAWRERIDIPLLFLLGKAPAKECSR